MQTNKAKSPQPLNRRGSRYRLFMLLACFPLLSLPLSAQPDGESNDLDRQLFPPELVMQHQVAIKLSEQQRKTLVSEIQDLQREIVPWQVEMSGAMEELVSLVSGAEVDEAKAVAQSLKVMDFETRVKSRHLTLLIRIKNLLTEEQQERLRGLR